LTPVEDEAKPYTIWDIVAVAWLVFIISGIVGLLDVFGIVDFPWNELELAVLLLSATLAIGISVGFEMRHDFDANDVCQCCGHASDDAPWSCVPGDASPRKAREEPDSVEHVGDAGENPDSTQAEPTPRPAAAALAGEKDEPDDGPSPPLFVAAEAGDADSVLTLLDLGADLNGRTAGGATALMVAAGQGVDELVDLLLSRGAEVDAQTETGHSALYLAAQNGYAGIVRALLMAGASVDMKTDWGATALQVAAQQGHVEVAKILLAHGATIDLDSKYVPRAVAIAVHEGHEEFTDLLVKATPGIVRVDGLAYLGTVGEGHLPIGEARLCDGRIAVSSWRPGYGDRAAEGAQPEPATPEGQSALFVFDYSRMSDVYGIEVFEAIKAGLVGSRGVCAFLDGDLDVAAGGSSAVPGLLMELRDGGWVIGTAQADSPLIFLATIDHLHAYVAAMWSDSSEAIALLDRHLTSRFPEAYLGFLQHPQRLDLARFHDILRPLQLPVRATYVDGLERVKS
jgi:hypothetical protein